MKSNPLPSSSEILNHISIAEGKLHIERDHNYCSYGFLDLKVWSTRTQQWILLTSQDEDKFIVTSDTYESAKSEFWARWKIYISRRFEKQYIPINIV